MIGHSMPVFQGYSSQYGHGLGNVLGGLVRSAMPIVGKIAKSAGAQLLETGLDFVKQKIKRRRTSSTSRHPRKRMKTRQVKRTTSQIPITHKRKIPPGRPVRRSKRKKTARDIFSS